MDKINKYLTESKERDAIQSLDRGDMSDLRDSYYGVGDHIERLAMALNVLVGETGEFGKDLKLAVQARDAYRKINLGRYV